ncbi:radical SAM protein [candidate division WOR-3 bacterium]|nr:radical SAM protein [candidate division WOR-3 bacterium]
MVPLYFSLKKEEFESRVEKLWEILSSCDLCGWQCKVNRLEQKGTCKSGIIAKVSSAFPHYGEERPLVGRNGSGTIFLSNCTCKCVYCQNWTISQKGEGKEVNEEDIALMMLHLQGIGCHNINWVTPTHFVPQLVKSLLIAKENGLKIPVVYNTGGYDSLKTLKLLKGIVNIYMPDIKYGSNENGLKYSKIPDYWDVARKAVKEMHSQVGDLKINDAGIAERGLLIRHLVLPNNIAESERVIEFIAKEISVNSYVNIMDQYRPCFNASKYEGLRRRITRKEYQEAVDTAKQMGLHRGFVNGRTAW